MQCHFQIYKVLNVKIVGLSTETWTSGDRYGNFNSDYVETLALFKNYTTYHVQESFDAAFLLT